MVLFAFLIFSGFPPEVTNIKPAINIIITEAIPASMAIKLLTLFKTPLTPVTGLVKLGDTADLHIVCEEGDLLVEVF